jgi:predicted RNA binding protein YcfA (HicA-like mRNA interferase family)
MSQFGSTEVRKFIKALQKYGLPMRNNGAHYIVTCPNNKVIISTKYTHMDRRWKDLEKAGIDIERVKKFM